LSRRTCVVIFPVSVYGQQCLLTIFAFVDCRLSVDCRMIAAVGKRRRCFIVRKSKQHYDYGAEPSVRLSAFPRVYNF